MAKVVTARGVLEAEVRHLQDRLTEADSEISGMEKQLYSARENRRAIKESIRNVAEALDELGGA